MYSSAAKARSDSPEPALVRTTVKVIGSPDLHPNSLYYGDCLEVMSHWPAEQVDLIYLDPPFKSDANYNQLFGTENGVPARVRAFTDTWTWNEAAAERYVRLNRATAHPAHKAIRGLHAMLGECGMLAYLTYMAERLAECRRVLKSTGSIYLHCDPTASHYLKTLMDTIFSARNFLNEVVWRRTGSHNSADRYGPIHDVILFYAKSEAYKHRPVFSPYLKGHVDDYFKKSDERGRYWTNSIHGSGTRNGESGKPWRGYDPTPAGRHWAVPGALVRALGIDPSLSQHKKLDALYELGVIDLPKSGLPTYRQYLETSPGLLLQDIWSFQPHTRGVLHQSDKGIDQDVRWIPKRDKKERLGYPTQKPLGLLERIVRASSAPGDLVLDPFCGCGTTIAAANRLDRKWIGIDISPFAARLVRDRRLKDGSINIYGIPVDMEGARLLLKSNPFDFEAWIVMSIEGLAANEVQVGDRGIDGRGAMFTVPNGESGLVLAQVKGSGYTASALRDFQGTMAREKATAGVFVTLERVETPAARAAAQSMGTYSIGATAYPRLQFWSAEEHLEGIRPNLPAMADPYTGMAVQTDMLVQRAMELLS